MLGITILPREGEAEVSSELEGSLGYLVRTYLKRKGRGEKQYFKLLY